MNSSIRLKANSITLRCFDIRSTGVVTVNRRSCPTQWNLRWAAALRYGGWPFVSVTTELKNNDFWPSPAGGKEEVIPFTIDGWLYLCMPCQPRSLPPFVQNNLFLCFQKTIQASFPVSIWGPAVCMGIKDFTIR